jgi:amidase
MKLDEYTSYDALGLAKLVRSKEITPAELVDCALAANALVNPQINAVIATCRTGDRKSLDNLRTALFAASRS